MSTGKLPSLAKPTEKVEVEISAKDSLDVLRKIAMGAERDKSRRRRVSRYS